MAFYHPPAGGKGGRADRHPFKDGMKRPTHAPADSNYSFLSKSGFFFRGNRVVNPDAIIAAQLCRKRSTPHKNVQAPCIVSRYTALLTPKLGTAGRRSRQQSANRTRAGPAGSPFRHCKGAVKRRTLLIRYALKRGAPIDPVRRETRRTPAGRREFH